MNLGEVPVIGLVFESGAKDRVFDGLLLLGPLVIGTIVALGRSTVTLGIAVTYICVFLAHVVQKWISSDS